MLLLFQSVQQLPPIHVTVQQPAGMPEWEKAAIAAGIGALFGIVGNILMEYVKPVISRRFSQKHIAKHIDQEFLKNLRIVETLGEMCEEIPEVWAFQHYPAMINEISRDRYDRFFTDQKATVYEIDPNGYLGLFYSTVTLDLSEALKGKSVQLAGIACARLTGLGKLYLQSRGLTDPGIDQPLIEAYRQVWDSMLDAQPDSAEARGSEG